MPGKRNDVEESAAFTRVTLAWVLVLAILFWVTTPLPENRSIRFSIQGSLDGDVACTGSEGECAEDTEMIRTSQAMPQEFNARRAMVWTAWNDSKQVSLWRPERLSMMAAFADKGKTRLAMRMVVGSAEARDQNVGE
jgi:hypothetical protein